VRYFIIGDEDAVLGFSMVGVKGRTVSNRNEAESALQEAISDQQFGIILITERVADLIRQEVDKYVFKSQFPLVVEIPDRLGKIPGKPAIRDLVNQAIGIKL
jgi:V/A-type H+/Na+-transporting ATPase subunit F